mmetsp:Transcript_83535/g.233113  ORF Transcript_83535/g.233113 Transcript_83535/m.233113 type:complete len:91 (+) Transcript_83535:15-287(+)
MASIIMKTRFCKCSRCTPSGTYTSKRSKETKTGIEVNGLPEPLFKLFQRRISGEAELVCTSVRDRQVLCWFIPNDVHVEWRMQGSEARGR